MSKGLKQTISGVVIFALGIACGVVFSNWHRHPPRMAPPHGRADVANYFFERMSQHLDLTDEQIEKAKPIFEAARKDMIATHEELRPRMEAGRLRTHEALKEILTPQQQVKLERMHTRFKKRREDGRGPFGKPGRGRRPGGPHLGGPPHEGPPPEGPHPEGPPPEEFFG